MQMLNGILEPRLLTVDQASRYLSLHPQTVYVMVKSGELPAVRVGRAVRFDKIALDAWIKKKIQENIGNMPSWSVTE